MLNRADLDSLIGCLRQELDHIEHAILALEQMARLGRREARVTDSRTVELRAAPGKIRKTWAHRGRVRPS